MKGTVCHEEGEHPREKSPTKKGFVLICMSHSCFREKGIVEPLGSVWTEAAAVILIVPSVWFCLTSHETNGLSCFGLHLEIKY